MQFQSLKKSVLQTFPVNLLLEWRRKAQLRLWHNAGRPLPPPQYYKQLLIADLQKQTGIKVLVETGTYLGDLVYAQRKNFSRLYSIELSSELYQKAAYRFRNLSHITIIHGDSATELPAVLTKISEPAIFWLDGHYSGGITANSVCPLRAELSAILATEQRHVILIDDARLLDGTNDYPTLEEVRQQASTHAPWLDFHVENDIVRLLPR